MNMLPLRALRSSLPRLTTPTPVRSYATLPGTGKTPIKKSDSFLKNIPIEVSPLVLAISGITLLASGALIRHLLVDEDLRVLPHQKGMIDDNDDALKKALASDGRKSK